MLKHFAILLAAVMLFLASLVEGKSGTICREYSDISNAGTCSGQTVYLHNNPVSKPPQDCVRKSKLKESIETKFQENYVLMENQLKNINSTLKKIINESLAKQSKNFCSSNPCENNGTCINGDTDYACKCRVGFEGSNCSKRNLCFSNPCQNNGTCTSGNMIYHCKCPLGHEGINCEKVSLCIPNPCENNGTCLNGITDYVCKCPVGYEGKNCNTRNLCYPNPCQNNGTCTSGNKIYQCKCPPSHKGINCSSRSCYDGLLFNNQRIYLPYAQGAEVKFAAAQQICRDNNSSLAEITSNSMYKAIENYVRTNWIGSSGWSYVYLWLGSTFEPLNNQCHLVSISNGMSVKLNESWFLDFPKFDNSRYAAYTHMLMEVASNSGGVSGIRNNCELCSRAVPLCACDATS